MTKGDLIDKINDNIDLVQRSRYKLDDIEELRLLDSWELINGYIKDIKYDLKMLERLYEKEIEKLGGNVI